MVKSGVKEDRGNESDMMPSFKKPRWKYSNDSNIVDREFGSEGGRLLIWARVAGGSGKVLCWGCSI